MITAIDPGGTTGVAMWDGDTTGFAQYDDWYDVPDSQWVAGADTLIIEKYTITPKTAKLSRQYDALYLIGALLYEHRWKDVVFQTPAEAKTFSTDSKLQRVGFWTTGKGHANDAARHLLLRLCKTGLINLKEVLNADL